jgi:Clr5 domain
MEAQSTQDACSSLQQFEWNQWPLNDDSGQLIFQDQSSFDATWASKPQTDHNNELPVFDDNCSWSAPVLAFRFREAPQYPSSRDWENIRPIFTRLYREEGIKLKDVKIILERDYGFVAS